MFIDVMRILFILVNIVFFLLAVTEKPVFAVVFLFAMGAVGIKLGL